MGSRFRVSPLLIAVAAAALIVTGCGGGSSSTSSAASSTSASSEEAGKSEDSEFTIPGAENGFGKEASAGEREAAYLVLNENLEARASHDWAEQCATLSAKGIKAIEENPKHKGKTCAEALSLESAGVPQGFLKNTLEGKIDALRVKGGEALALWHGSGEADYAMLMENENGRWKVAALISTPLPNAAPPTKEKPKPAPKPQTKARSGSA